MTKTFSSEIYERQQKNMKSIYMMISVLTATSLAQGSIKCSFSEVTGAQPCHGVVGQLLIFNLPNTTDRRIRMKKDKIDLIIELKKSKIKFNGEYTNNPELFANGSLKLGEATKNHSGVYTLEEHGLTGVFIRKLHVHLEIQAPVSKPAVFQTCLSPEQMKVTCSSEGHGVEFILTLDNHVLIQTRNNSKLVNSRIEKNKSLEGTTEQDKLSVSSVTISLYGGLTGDFSCTVWNNAIREETVRHLTSCKVSSLYSAVVVTIISTFLAVFLLVALNYGIIILRNSTPVAVPNDQMDNTEDDVIYAEVRIIQNMRTPELNLDQNSTDISPTLSRSSAM